jgi:methylglutaconyl-CoA hydratase
MEFLEISRLDSTGFILMNRPAVRNAMNPLMIREMIRALQSLSGDPGVRAIVIRGSNGVFSSGADLAWLRDSGSGSLEENISENRLLAEWMETLRAVPVPLISVVEGAAFGGALGILGCSDWVISAPGTIFSFSEVRLGLAPAVILPYVMARAPGIRTRQLMLTGKRFDAQTALDAGLVDFIGDAGHSEAKLNELLEVFRELPPQAVREVKRLWFLAKTMSAIDYQTVGIESLATLKQSDEARNLLNRFLHRHHD